MSIDNSYWFKDVPSEPPSNEKEKPRIDIKFDDLYKYQDFYFNTNRWHEDRWCVPIEGKIPSPPSGPLEELFFYISEGEKGKLETLLKDPNNKSFVNLRNKFGYTPLQWCAFYDRPDMVNLLVDSGADIHMTDLSYLDTPLHNAAKLGRISVILALLARGADTTKLNIAKNTPIKAARNIETIQAIANVTYSEAVKEMMNRFETIQETINLGEPIGRGGFGTVYQVFNAQNEKILSVFKEVDQQDLVKKEIEIHSRLGSEFIISIRGARVNNPPFGFEMRQATHGSLSSIIHNNGSPIDLREHGILFLFDIAQGMIHIHENEFLHRDLKSPNVLITEDFDFSRKVMDFRPIAKISDFGIARNKWFDGKKSENYPVLLSPEKISGRYKILPFEKKTKFDVYCFGLLMWEMLTGKKLRDEFAEVLNVPLPERDDEEEQENFWNNLVEKLYEYVPKGLRPRIPTCNLDGYISLMQRCWAPGVNDRPTFIQISEELLKLKNFKFGTEPTDCHCRFCMHKKNFPCDYQVNKIMPCKVCQDWPSPMIHEYVQQKKARWMKQYPQILKVVVEESPSTIADYLKKLDEFPKLEAPKSDECIVFYVTEQVDPFVSPKFPFTVIKLHEVSDNNNDVN